jgi:uncharacterized protein (DUF983 family)
LAIHEKKMGEFRMGKKMETIKLTCPYCSENLVAYRDALGRVFVVSGRGIAMTFMGIFIGTVVGIAMWRDILTVVVFAVAGLLIGSIMGYIFKAKSVNESKCPKCQRKLSLKNSEFK